MIYHCDCLKGFEDFGRNSVDLIITDPPYGVEFCKNKMYDDSKDTVFNLMPQWLKGMADVLKDGSHCYIFVPTLEIDKWVNEVKNVFKFKNLLATSIYTTSRYLKENFTFDLQLIIFCSKGKAKRLNKVNWVKTSESWLKDKRNPNPKEFTYQYPSFIKDYRANIKPNVVSKVLHPNQKNELLLRVLIELSSNEGERVLDPFCGCGSVPLAALSVDRVGEGFELNKEYFDLSLRRYNNKDYFFKIGEIEIENELMGSMIIL